MKTMCFRIGAALSVLLVASVAPGQTLRQPLSVRPVGMTSDLDYNYYYYDQEEASPSDVKPAAPKPAAKPAPKPVPEPAAQSISDSSMDCGCASASACDGSGVGCDGCGVCGGGGSCYLLGGSKAWSVFDNDSRPLNVGFWTQIGYHTPGANGIGTGLMNDYPNRVQLQQQWLYLEKVADTGGAGMDWGFRFDYVYGTDGPDTQAFGGGPDDWDNGWEYGGAYGSAIPQAYAELAYNKLSVKIGHFYTIQGYEVIPATGNFFYSHSFSFYNIEPFTHTGAILQYDLSDDVKAWGGWTQGWDTGFENNGGSMFLGGFSLQLTDNLNFTYTTSMGDFGYDTPNGVGSDSNGYAQSLLVTYKFRDRWTYAVESDLVDNDIFLGSTKDAFDIAQYLTYDWSDCFGFGLRYEWFKDPRFGRGAAGEVNSLTLGANYHPMANLVIRPEVRWDDYKVNNALSRRDTTLFGIDAVLTY